MRDPEILWHGSSHTHESELQGRARRRRHAPAQAAWRSPQSQAERQDVTLGVGGGQTLTSDVTRWQ